FSRPLSYLAALAAGVRAEPIPGRLARFAAVVHGPAHAQVYHRAIRHLGCGTATLFRADEWGTGVLPGARAKDRALPAERGQPGRPVRPAVPQAGRTGHRASHAAALWPAELPGQGRPPGGDGGGEARDG